MNTMRIILLLVAHFGWDLQQLNDKNVLLHGDLESELYTEIPLGFDSYNFFFFDRQNYMCY